MKSVTTTLCSGDFPLRGWPGYHSEHQGHADCFTDVPCVTMAMQEAFPVSPSSRQHRCEQPAQASHVTSRSATWMVLMQLSWSRGKCLEAMEGLHGARVKAQEGITYGCKRQRSPCQCFSPGAISPSGNVQQHLQSFPVVTTGRRRPNTGGTGIWYWRANAAPRLTVHRTAPSNNGDVTPRVSPAGLTTLIGAEKNFS